MEENHGPDSGANQAGGGERVVPVGRVPLEIEGHEHHFIAGEVENGRVRRASVHV